MTRNSIPLIVLTSSDVEEDVKECYELGCNAYVTKQMDIQDLVDIFKAIEMLFFRAATGPTSA